MSQVPFTQMEHGHQKRWMDEVRAESLEQKKKKKKKKKQKKKKKKKKKRRRRRRRTRRKEKNNNQQPEQQQYQQQQQRNSCIFNCLLTGAIYKRSEDFFSNFTCRAL